MALRPSPLPMAVQHPHSAFQPPLRIMLATMGAMLAELTNLMTRLEVWKKKKCLQGVDIILGYTRNHDLNPSCHQPQPTAAPFTRAQASVSTSNFRPPAARHSAIQVASAASFTSVQALATTSRFKLPALPLGTSGVAQVPPQNRTQALADHSGSLGSPPHLRFCCSHQKFSTTTTHTRCHSGSPGNHSQVSRCPPKLSSKANGQCTNRCYVL